MGAAGSGWSAGLRGYAYARVDQIALKGEAVCIVTRSNHRMDELLEVAGGHAIRVPVVSILTMWRNSRRQLLPSNRIFRAVDKTRTPFVFFLGRSGSLPHALLPRSLLGAHQAAVAWARWIMPDQAAPVLLEQVTLTGVHRCMGAMCSSLLTISDGLLHTKLICDTSPRLYCCPSSRSRLRWCRVQVVPAG